MSWPVSVKGVLAWGGRVVLLRNERDEWELPGGRIDPDDGSPEAALRRELAEELGVTATIGGLLDVWRYDPLPGRPVLIVAYRCSAPRPDVLTHSDEHLDVALFGIDELDGLSLPDGYRRCVQRALVGG